MKKRPAAALGNDQNSRSVVKASTCAKTEEYEHAKQEAVESMKTGDVSLLPCISKFAVAVSLGKGPGVEDHSILDVDIYKSHLGRLLSIDTNMISCKLDGFIVSFGYKFPESSFLSNFSPGNWQTAIADLAPRSDGWVSWGSARANNCSL